MGKEEPVKDWIVEPRYWSPDRQYATGDVLITLLREGWQVIGNTTARREGHTLLYACTLAQGDVTLALQLLDSPAVREILDGNTPHHAHAA